MKLIRISQLPEVDPKDKEIFLPGATGREGKGDTVKVSVSKILKSAGGGGFYNLDNEMPLPDGQRYTLETAVAALAEADLYADKKNGMIMTFYDGGQWRAYQYQLMYDPQDEDAQANFANPENWKEFESGGGGGGGDATRIVLQRITPDIVRKVGDDVLLMYHYDHVTGEGDDEHSTGLRGTATYTVTRGGVQVARVVQSIGAGDITFNATRYCGVGITQVRLQVTVDTGEMVQRAALAWSVTQVNLKLTTDLTGYTVIQQGTPLQSGYVLESGSSDTKTVQCWVDGVNVGQQSKNVSVSSGVFIVDTSLLSHGMHTVQIQAQQPTGEKDGEGNDMYIYSNLIYAVVGVTTAAGTSSIVTMLLTVESDTIFMPQDTVRIGAKQYSRLPLRFGAVSPAGYAEVVIARDGDTVYSGEIRQAEETVSIGMLEDGEHVVTLTAGGTAQLSVSVDVEHVDLGVSVPGGRTLFLDSVQHGHNNTSEDRDVWSSTENGVTTSTVMSGFKFVADGWTGDALRVMGSAVAEIGYCPFERTQSGGTTIGLRYNVRAYDEANVEPVVTCIDGQGTGFAIYPDNIELRRNGSVAAQMRTAPGYTYDVAFVAWPAGGTSAEGRKNAGFVYLYIDGIVSGGFRLAEGETMWQGAPVPVTIGSAYATIDVYRLYGFRRALGNSEMLDCAILNRDDDMESLIDMRDRNSILDVSGDVTPDSLPDGTRIMVITGTAMSDSDGVVRPSVLAAAHDNSKSKYFPCEEILTYIKGAEDRSRNFIARNNGSDIQDGKDMSLKLRLQGTSSLAYPVKNYRIYTKKSTMYVGINPETAYGESGELSKGGKFALHADSAPVAVWCLKADYAESSSSHNTGMARLVNDTLDSVGVPTPAQRDVDTEQYPYDVRTTVDGEPCILFYRETLSDTPRLLGKFNWNNDKSTETVYGFTGIKGYHDTAPLDDIGNTETLFTAQQYHLLHGGESGYEPVGDLTECWEFTNNEDPMGSFLDDDFTADVTDDDGTHRKWTGTFEARYPDEDALNDDFASGAIVPHYLSMLVAWVKSTHVEDGDTEEEAEEKLAKFREELPLYFDLRHLCSYFSFTQMMACLDQMVKNMMMAFWYDKDADEGSPMGKVRAYMIFYDNDTILGVVNNGRLLAPYNVDRQTLQQSPDVYFYAGHDSVLWNNLQACFPNEIRSAYADLRRVLTNAKLFEYFDETQSDMFCERIYNLDAINKYVAPESMSEAAVSPYRDLMQGSRRSHRHWFVENRMSLYDNIYRCGEFYSAHNEISWKGISPAGSAIGFTLRQSGNVEVQSDVSDDFVRNYPVAAGVPTTITKATPSAVGTIIHLYGIRQMTALDLSAWDFDQLNLGDFPSLSEFILNVSDGGFGKPGFNGSLAVGDSMRNLKRFVAQGCAALTSVDLGGCYNIMEIDLSASTLCTSVAFPDGAPLTSYVVPAASGYRLRLVGLDRLRMREQGGGNGLLIEDYSKIATLTVRDCALINGLDILTSVIGSQNQLTAVDMSIGDTEGPLDVIAGILSVWNHRTGSDSNVILDGRYDINTTSLSVDVVAIGYDLSRVGEWQQIGIPGLYVRCAGWLVVTPVLQSFKPDSAGYNPAACIVLANAGYGTYADSSDHTKGWYITAQQAIGINLSTTFNNLVSVVDAESIVVESGGATDVEYYFTDGDFFKNFAGAQKISNCTLLEHADFSTWNVIPYLQNNTSMRSVILPSNPDATLVFDNQNVLSGCYELEDIVVNYHIARLLRYCGKGTGTATINISVEGGYGEDARYRRYVWNGDYSAISIGYMNNAQYIDYVYVAGNVGSYLIVSGNTVATIKMIEVGGYINKKLFDGYRLSVTYIHLFADDIATSSPDIVSSIFSKESVVLVGNGEQAHDEALLADYLADTAWTSYAARMDTWYNWLINNNYDDYIR